MEMISCLSFSPSIPIPIERANNQISFSSSLRSGSNLLNCSAVRINTNERRRRRNKPLTCNALFGLGVPELVVIAGVAALVFGPKKLPEVGRSIGKTVKSFQQAAKEFESELKKEPDSTEKPVAAASQQEETQDIEVSSSSKESV